MVCLDSAGFRGPPPSPRECDTRYACGYAQSEDRHPIRESKQRCPVRQPDSPHPEKRSKAARLEGRGRAHHREPYLTIPLRLADYVSDPPPPATQVEASASPQRRGIASISAKHWGRWIARSCAQDGGGAPPASNSAESNSSREPSFPTISKPNAKPAAGSVAIHPHPTALSAYCARHPCKAGSRDVQRRGGDVIERCSPSECMLVQPTRGESADRSR